MVDGSGVMKGKTMIASAIAVVVLAVIVIMSIAVLEGFSEELRDDATGTNVEVIATLAAVNVSADIISTFPFAQTITSCVNSTGSDVAAVNYTFVVGDIPRSGVGTVTLVDGSDGGLIGDSLNCTITYKADTTEQAAADDFVTGLGVFGTFIGIIVLAIVAIIVIGIFVRSKKGGE